MQLVCLTTRCIEFQFATLNGMSCGHILSVATGASCCRQQTHVHISRNMLRTSLFGQALSAGMLAQGHDRMKLRPPASLASHKHVRKTLEACERCCEALR